jgi:hypothetical protein
MENNGMVQMVGYDYMVDVANRAVYRNDGRPIKMVVNNCGSHYMLTRQDGKRKSISANCVMYAAMIGISPDTIPKDIYVVERGGVLRLMYHKDMNDENHKKARENHIKKWRNIMTQRMAEMQLLIDYYDTGDASPVVKYVLNRNDRLAAYISDHFHCSRQTSCDVASEVIEDICRRAVSHNLYVSSISTALRGYARNAIKKRRQTVAYEE